VGDVDVVFGEGWLVVHVFLVCKFKVGLRQLCLLRSCFLPCGSPTTAFGDDVSRLVG